MKTKVGFAVHDAARDGRAFEVEEEAGRALVFGSSAAVSVQGRGVLPKHFVVLPHEGMLLAASASAQAPAYVNEQPLGGDWTVLELPCRVRLGAAVIEFFVLPAAPDHDARSGIEETRIGPLPAMPVRPGASPEIAAQTARGPKDLAVLAACRLRDDYRRLSRPKRLLVPVAGLLAFLSLARPSQADEAPQPAAPAPQVSPSRPGAPAFDAASSLAASPAAVSTVTPADSRLGRPPASAAEPARGPVALPSARSLPVQSQVHLAGQERVIYHRAIEATLAGDFATAYRLYDQLAAAHPEAGDIRAAQRVLAIKLKAPR